MRRSDIAAIPPVKRNEIGDELDGVQQRILELLREVAE